MEQYRLRDEEKRRLCEKAGIRLVTIPYWWDKKQESLAATLFEEMPSLFNSYTTESGLMARIRSGEAVPIPSQCPPSMTVRNEASRSSSVAQLSGVWHDAVDPEGMFVCERLEGVSVRWVEGQLSTRHGRVIPVPEGWARHMPKRDCDGVLWMGENSVGRLVNVIASSRGRPLLADPMPAPSEEQWQAVDFVAVDVPELSKSFADRLAVLSSLEQGGNFRVMPYATCEGRQHLDDLLSKSPGSGLLLRDPSSLYRISSSFWQVGTLRAQQALAASATVVGRANKTRGLRVEVQEGLVQVARCSESQYYAAAPGDSVKVGHFGVWPTGRLKHAFLY